MSAFDADAFLSQEINANFDTEYTPIPEGEFEAQVDEVKVRSFTDKQTGEEKPILNLRWSITDPDVKSATGMEEPKVFQSVFMDIEGGVLATGTNKNIMLGKLKDLAGNPKNFTLMDLNGVSAIVKVKQRLMDDGRISSEVKQIAAI